MWLFLGKIIPRAIMKSRVPPAIPKVCWEMPINSNKSSPKKVKRRRITKAMSISLNIILLCFLPSYLDKRETNRGIAPMEFITRNSEKERAKMDMVIILLVNSHIIRGGCFFKEITLRWRGYSSCSKSVFMA